ncbi:hypothetical protein SAMN04488128_102190 [Chitinophaga eiseniae]|uniref:Uncharacterized protein n=1 Tax=Chitinophaga eiseniae TaxID=634771 RepID=A0A1T4Q6Q7_9BACT|nr:hypothetical protein SAMN04488128_102190 [Chitinophaga eiseniae]
MSWKTDFNEVSVPEKDKSPGTASQRRSGGLILLVIALLGVITSYRCLRISFPHSRGSS